MRSDGLEAGEGQRRQRSLVGQTLRRTAFRIGIVVAIASAISFLHVRRTLEQQAQEQLRTYAAERREREEAVFELAEERLQAVAEAIDQALLRPPGEHERVRFHALFERREDGTVRVRPEVYARYGITGIIGKNSAVGPAEEALLPRIFDVLAAHGAAWRPRFRNLFIVTAGNVALMYWPDKPWALHSSDWEIYGKLALSLGGGGEPAVLGLKRPAGPPGTAWSEPYFDYGGREWVISATRVVERLGEPIGTIGQDILLDELFQRTVASHADGTYSMIIDAGGRLIAHPDYMLVIRARSAAIPLEETGDPRLLATFEQVRAAPAGTIVENREADEFVAGTRLAGPGWYLLTVFPESIVSMRAASTARYILALGALALLLEITVLYLTLRRQVAAPLGDLVQAAGAVAAGRFDGPLPLHRRDELGQLARAFRDMVGQIQARETSLAERGRHLAELNARLEEELEQRRLAQAELERQRELHALLDSIDYGVLFTDPALRVRLHNRAYRELTGVPQALLDQAPTLEELVDYGFDQGTLAPPPGGRVRYMERFLEMVRTAPPEPFEWRLADGRVLRRRIAALPDGSRLLTYFDLTQLKETQAQLTAAKEAAEQASVSKSAFLASVSHEFRTPLNAITGYSELLTEEAIERGAADMAADLGRIRDAGRQLLTLINDLLDLSKIEAGRMEVHPRRFALPALVDGVLATMAPLVDGAAVELRALHATDLPEIEADPDRVRQILVNLVGNATKFTKQGSISVASRRVGESVEVDVADTGIGIPAEARERVFGEFLQVADPSGRRDGTGLGLAISRRLARLMGGDIRLESEPGVGSTFTLVLPLRPPATGPGQEPNLRPEGGTTALS